MNGKTNPHVEYVRRLSVDVVVCFENLNRIIDQIRWQQVNERARMLTRRWRRMRSVNFGNYGSE